MFWQPSQKAVSHASFSSSSLSPSKIKSANGLCPFIVAVPSNNTPHDETRARTRLLAIEVEVVNPSRTSRACSAAVESTVFGSRRSLIRLPRILAEEAEPRDGSCRYCPSFSNTMQSSLRLLLLSSGTGIIFFLLSSNPADFLAGFACIIYRPFCWCGGWC